jgi:hypothetical protein
MRQRYKRIRGKKKGMSDEDGRDDFPRETKPAHQMSSDDQLTTYLDIFAVLTFLISLLDPMMRCHLIWQQN